MYIFFSFGILNPQLSAPFPSVYWNEATQRAACINDCLKPKPRVVLSGVLSILVIIDLFTDTGAILNKLIVKFIMGC